SAVGNTKSFNFSGLNVPYGWPQYCSGCRIIAQWDGTYTIANDSTCSSQPQQWGQAITSNQSTWPTFTCTLPTSAGSFFLINALPSTFSVQSAGISSTGGPPRL